MKLHDARLILAMSSACFLLSAKPSPGQVDWSMLFPGEGAPTIQEESLAPALPSQPAVRKVKRKPSRAAARIKHRAPVTRRKAAVSASPKRAAPRKSVIKKAAARTTKRRAAVRAVAPRKVRKSTGRVRAAIAPHTKPVERAAAKRKPVRPPAKSAAAHAVAAARKRHAAPQPAPKRVGRLVVEQPAPPAPPASEPRATQGELPIAQAPREGTGLRLEDFGLRPGEIVGEADLPRFVDLITPGVEWGVRYGWQLRLVEPRRIRMPQAYREATEKYAGQVKLGPGAHTLVNYVAGRPFPNVDPNEPDAAMKIMWNYDHNFLLTDDVTMRYFEADTGSVRPNEPRDVERHYMIDRFARMSYEGRLYVDPKPRLPSREGFRWKESLHPIVEPFDLKGAGVTFYRYLDPTRQDDNWIYLPQLRRVRRMSSAQRSDALFGQDLDADSFWGYNGHIAWMDYKLLGERTVLASMHAEHVPVKWQDPEDWLFDDVWEPREVWVVEARSKFSQYAYGKRVIFIDKQSYLATHSDIYDRGGQLWKVWVNMWSVKKEAIPGARISRYKDPMPFQHALLMLDVQLAHTTSVALPSTQARGQECWFFNMGEKMGTTESFFSIAQLIETGH